MSRAGDMDRGGARKPALVTAVSKVDEVKDSHHAVVGAIMVG
jgi:hypothetical protein